MVTNYNQQAIQGVISASYVQRRPAAKVPVVVTISRDCGCRGQFIAQQLAERLGVPLYGRTLLEAVVARSSMDPELVRQLDENSHHHVTGFLQKLLFNEDVKQWSYRKTLVKVIAGVLNTGGVVLGRGAHIILAGQGVFRVRLVGAEEHCAERLVQDGRADNAASALQLVRETNQKRAAFLLDHFQVNIDDPRQYDLVVNTDHISPVQVVDMVSSVLALGALPLEPAAV